MEVIVWWKRHPARMLLIAVLLSLPLRVGAADGNAPDGKALMTSRLLKHRVEVVTPPPVETGKEAMDLEVSRRKESLLEGGVAISRVEWATAVDILKEKLASSELFRLVEAVPAGSGGKPDDKNMKDEPPLVLNARFSTGAEGKQVFLRLSKRGDGYLMASAKASAPAMEAAVLDALGQIEKDAVLQAWRCRVVDAEGDRLLIARGYLDGLRNGQMLTGYSMDARAKEASGQPEEFLLMKYGTRVGTYEVVEPGQDFSRLKPVKDSRMLAVGDLLEIPAVHLRDTNNVTRGSKVWERVYEK